PSATMKRPRSGSTAKASSLCCRFRPTSVRPYASAVRATGALRSSLGTVRGEYRQRQQRLAPVEEDAAREAADVVRGVLPRVLVPRLEDAEVEADDHPAHAVAALDAALDGSGRARPLLERPVDGDVVGPVDRDPGGDAGTHVPARRPVALVGH